MGAVTSTQIAMVNIFVNATNRPSINRSPQRFDCCPVRGVLDTILMG
jgi:hypothetical protein